MPPEGHSGRLRRDVPQSHVDESDRTNDEARASDRDRFSRTRVPEGLRVGFAAGDDRRDEPLDASCHGCVPRQAVGLADETVLRLHLHRCILPLADLHRPEPERLRQWDGRRADPDRRDGLGHRFTLTP